MAESAATAISAAKEAYKAQDAAQVLEQFHDEALIIGTREEERWESPEAFRDALEYELSVVTVEGPLAESGAEESFTRQISEDIATYFQDGYIVFNGKRIRGRWTAVVKADEDGDWKIVHSHFSLPEGHTSPGGETSA